MAKAWATIRDVAAQAGVSVSTASKAFNNKAEVAPATRRRVLAAATTLHFTPNALVRSLQQGRTNTIGVCAWPIQSGSAHDITMPLLTGIAASVSASGLDLLLYALDPAIEVSFTAASFMDGRVDGIILGPTVLTTEELAELATAGLPTVVLYREDVPAALGAVTIDNRSGIKAIFDHLALLGHKRIAFSGQQVSSDMRERYSAYQDGLIRHGLAFDPALCVLPETWLLDFPAECARLLSLPNPPTALIAGDDAQAFQWTQAFVELGLRVPEEISITGFDDSPAAGAGLTTVRQPAERVGRTAGLLISQLVTGTATERQVQMPVEFVARSSTAAPR